MSFAVISNDSFFSILKSCHWRKGICAVVYTKKVLCNIFLHSFVLLLSLIFIFCSQSFLYLVGKSMIVRNSTVTEPFCNLTSFRGII